MKKFAKRFNNSLKNLGISGTFQNILNVCEDYLFDFYYRTNTIKTIKFDSKGIKSDSKQYSFGYESTRGRPFKKLIKTLDFPKDSEIVDFGAGTGKVLILALQCNKFNRIVGIETSPVLCQIARNNLLKFYKKNGMRDKGRKCFVVESDILDYNIMENENVFFMFNPFSDVVIKPVIKKIKESIRKNDRKVWIIYSNPVFLNVIDKLLPNANKKTFSHGSVVIAIYEIEKSLI